MKPEFKKDWVPSEGAFRRLLGWLDEGVDSGGEKYLEMRRRLAAYFDRRNCPSPDELADETLNRVARRLEEQGTISETPPARYCYIAARFVFLESVRQGGRAPAGFDARRADPASLAARPAEPDSAARQELLDCLEQCLQQIPPRDRDLIVGYYHGEQRAKIEHRQQLAALLGLTVNALSIRACRIRDKLEACLKTHAASA